MVRVSYCSVFPFDKRYILFLYGILNHGWSMWLVK
ncbi:Uncharacterised protein [Vibrio cholerae]|nr:Uncharacterised protein [Vibrio cholerae]